MPTNQARGKRCITHAGSWTIPRIPLRIIQRNMGGGALKNQTPDALPKGIQSRLLCRRHARFDLFLDNTLPPSEPSLVPPLGAGALFPSMNADYFAISRMRHAEVLEPRH